MKLYTEFEVRNAIELARDTHQEGKPYLEKDEYDYSVDEIVNYLLTPIELPSDEEIYNEAQIKKDNIKLLPFDMASFQFGAMWLKDKIQGGNK